MAYGLMIMLKMACDFNIPFSVAASELISQVKSAITEAGGQFSGDEQTGNFNLSIGIGAIKGDYQIENGNFHIHISEKPSFIGCEKIENEVRKYLRGKYA
jgi:hypothetical protein